jgi:chromosome segregation ATPase
MGRSVSAAAAQAVAKSNRKSEVERTPDDIIADIRKNASAGLSVTSADILLLLRRFDSFRTTMVQATNQLNASTETLQELGNEIETLKAEKQQLQEVNTILNENIAQLTAKNEEFRSVYEIENRAASVKVEKVDEFENVKVETTVGTNSNELQLATFAAGVLDQRTSGSGE